VIASAASSTTVDTAGECIISDNNRERNQVLKCVVRDELMLFSDSEIEQILEQAKLKCFPTSVHAKQWAIADSGRGAVIFGKDSGTPAEIAS
jgi:hypothetical protein